jgi:PAS domain S-box-containing protein
MNQRILERLDMSRLPPWFDDSTDDADVAVVMIGVERAISYANKEAHRLLGSQVGRLLGLAMDRLSVPERRGELRNIEDVLQGGGARRVRTVLRREDGTRVTVTAHYEPCYSDIGVVEAVAIRYELLSATRSLAPLSMPPSTRPSPSYSIPSPVYSTPSPVYNTPSPAFAPPSAPTSTVPPVRSGPVPRASEQRLSPLRVAGEMEQRLGQLERHLRWLEDRLSVPATSASLDDARERARALLVLADARSLLRETLQIAGFEQVEHIPAAPKVPKL